MKKYNSFLGAFFSGDNGQGGYNAAYRQGALAKLYTGSLPPEQQQEAVAGLARVDPDAAYKFQQTQQAAQQESLKRKAMLIANAPPAQRGQLYASVLPEIRKDWADAPDAYDANIDAMVTNWAKTVSGATNQNTGVQSTFISGGKLHYLTRDGKPVDTGIEVDDRYTLEIDPQTGMPYRFGARRGVLEGVNGGSNVGPQPNPATQQTPTAGSGGIVFPEDVSGAAQRTGDVMQQVRTEIAQLVAQGVPVADATSQVTQKYASQRGLTMPPQGQAPAPVVQQPVASTVAQRPVPQYGGYQGMSAAEKARAEAEAKAAVELKYAPQVEAAKLGVQLETAPRLEGAKAEQQAVGKARGERSATGEKRASEAGDAIELLNQAEELLRTATGGFFGAKADEFAAAFGKSTKGAEANAELNVIAPKLIGLVPRFEGPQSDADRKLYENAAGDLGNPYKLASVRLAALRRMRQIYQKYEAKAANSGQGKSNYSSLWGD